ncbi:hypothetical protein FACS1894199_11570 [Bacteroidia bacterium]|nr:hypothetical protein FACS1894199_11570 [Bacteroidia bacterium]
MDTSDGFIYGLDQIQFKGQILGYISEEGLTPGGDAPSTTKIRAAQAGNAVVKNLLTTPGSKTFTGNLIQLNTSALKNIFGGEVDEDTGVYTAPPRDVVQEGSMQINCSSGHVIIAPKVSLTANLANAINLSQTLAVACTFEIMVPDNGSSPWQVYPPGAELPEA